MQVLMVLLGAMLQAAVAAQSSVYVKFLSPPYGYSHNLHLDPRGGIAVAKEDRIYPGDSSNTIKKLAQFQENQNQQGLPLYNQFQPDLSTENRLQYRQLQQPTGYIYNRPMKTLGDGASLGFVPYQTLQTFGRDQFPSTFSYNNNELGYDPTLVTGPQAAQYVSYLFSRGELFFHQIPHEKLVLMNQQERIENNLIPHILASIRIGHPFFLHR